MSRLSALLTVRQEVPRSEYSFSYTDWTLDFSHSWTLGLTSSETHSLNAHLSRFARRPAIDAMVDVQEILNHLLPKNILDFLTKNPPHSLAVVSDEHGLPWEWVGTPQGPLFCLTEVTRDISQRPSSTPMMEHPQVFGLVADTLTRQSGSDDEINTVWNLLKETSARVLNASSTASRESLLDALYGDRFSSMHLACPGMDALEVGGSLIQPLQEAREQRTSPRWVFFHNFLRPEGPASEMFAPPQTWAESLFSHGCEAFLSNLWAGSPNDQRRFSRELYSTLLCPGETLGSALHSARRALWQKGSIMGAAYCLFGNPQISLEQMRPMRVRESTTVPGGLSSCVQLRVLNGPEEGRMIPLFTSALRQRGLVLGSSGPRACDVELEGQLPNQTAFLQMHDETLVLTNMCGDPGLLQVNGLPVPSALALSGWERIRLGDVEIQMEAAEGTVPTQISVPRAFCLEVHDGEKTRTEWFVDDLVTVGRGSSARIPFGDQSVSRTHALLQRSGDTLIVSRLGLNLVAVNGVPTEKAHELSPGDLVQLTDRAFFKVLRVLN